MKNTEYLPRLTEKIKTTTEEGSNQAMTQRPLEIYSFTQQYYFEHLHCARHCANKIVMSVGHNPLELEGLGSAPCFHFAELCNPVKLA